MVWVSLSVPGRDCPARSASPTSWSCAAASMFRNPASSRSSAWARPAWLSRGAKPERFGLNNKKRARPAFCLPIVFECRSLSHGRKNCLFLDVGAALRPGRSKALIGFQNHQRRGIKTMQKVLLAVDGSESSVRATQALIDSLSLYKEQPEIHVLTVHRPIPNIGTMSSMVTQEMRDSHYSEDCEAALAPVTA